MFWWVDFSLIDTAWPQNSELGDLRRESEIVPEHPVPLSSVRNGLGAPAAPRGNCQEDWTGPDDNFYSVPSWHILGLQV